MAEETDRISETIYLRFMYPLENRLLRRFGRKRDCGCEILWGRQLRLCWQHVTKP